MPHAKEEEPIKASVLEALRQGECLLEALENETYNRRVPAAFDGTIGGHYRHCLEHFEALLGEDDGTLAVGIVDYDARARDKRLETDREHALGRTKELARIFARLMDGEWAGRPVDARSKVSYPAAGSPAAPSSLGREAMYAVVHAIHHYALIGIMGRLLGVRLPEGFGVAPSTLQYRAENDSVAPEDSVAAG